MKKALKIIKNVLLILMIVIALGMVAFVFVSMTFFNRNDRELFGYRVYIVVTDSMSATDFDAGDLIFVKEVDSDLLEAGDVITFLSQEGESFGQVVTHKIRRRAVNQRNEQGFVTYGTTTGVDDEEIVTPMYILGKYQFRIPKLGAFFNYLKTPAGYILLILVPFLILILSSLIRSIRLFRAYRDEERAALEAEKEKNQKSREEAEALQKELSDLKEQLRKTGWKDEEEGSGERQKEHME